MAGLPREGDTYGRFQIRRQIGRGGMGAVFEAYDPTLRRQVALKVVLPGLADLAEARERFEREARMLAKVRSSHIVHVHDVGEHDDSLYLVTELIPDGDLHTLLTTRGALPPADALRLVAQLCDGLADAHAAGIVHRDVKPRNVLLWNREGTLVGYLCDFGIALDESPGLTQTGALVGSLEFMAPERHLGQTATDRGDLYSMGCVLWACLTGAPPYSGTEYQLMNAHISDPLPPLRLVGDGPTVHAVESLLGRLLSKDPAARPGSASVVAREARQLADRLERSQPAAPAPEWDGDVTIYKTLPRQDVLGTPPARDSGGFYSPPTQVPLQQVTTGAPGPGGSTGGTGTGTRPAKDRRAVVLVGLVVAALVAIALGGVAVAQLGTDDDEDPDVVATSTPTADESTTPDPVAEENTPNFPCDQSLGQASPPRSCSRKEGYAAMQRLFPRLTRDCRPKYDLGVSVPGRLFLLECRSQPVGGVFQGVIYTSFWENAAAAESYLGSVGMGGPSAGTANGLATQEWYSLNSRGGPTDETYEKTHQAARLYTDDAFMVEVYATDPSLRDRLLTSTFVVPIPPSEY